MNSGLYDTSDAFAVVVQPALEVPPRTEVPNEIFLNKYIIYVSIPLVESKWLSYLSVNYLWSQKTSIPPPQGFWFIPPIPPSVTFAFAIPLPLGISIDLPWLFRATSFQSETYCLAGN